MPEESRATADAVQQRPNGDRLESWKEIARYLRRDVRTVQRWEESDGMPVRRLRRAHRAIPYAYKTELDTWWTSRSTADPPEAIEPQGSSAAVSRLAARPVASVALAAIVVVALTGGTYWLLRTRSDHPLTEVAPAPPVTTTSKTALSLFTEANRILEENGDNGAAEALLREAIANDPRFASGYIFLAWAVRRQNRPSSDYLPVAARAEQLAANATESERLFIRASADDMRGHEEEACGTFAALVRVQPDHSGAGTTSLIATAVEVTGLARPISLHEVPTVLPATST
jgi:hypothetical protein